MSVNVNPVPVPGAFLTDKRTIVRMIMAKHLRPNNRAFSILQLLVVISMLVALATVAIPQAAL